MAAITWALSLLLVGSLLLQGSCQHWSFGLNPGGRRDLERFSGTLDNIAEGFPDVDPPCSALACAEESPFAKIYRERGLLASVTDRENGHRMYKNDV